MEVFQEFRLPGQLRKAETLREIFPVFSVTHASFEGNFRNRQWCTPSPSCSATGRIMR